MEYPMSMPINVKCAKCFLPIFDQFYLQSNGSCFHENCLTCSMCNIRLCDYGEKYFCREGFTFCEFHYKQKFSCVTCQLIVKPNEMIMRARNRLFHLGCFCCSACGNKFCVGERIYMHDNQILCEYDQQEQNVFRQTAFNDQSRSVLTKNIQQLDLTDERLTMQKV